MGRLIDTDKLWKDTTSNIDYCEEFLEIIEKQETSPAISIDWIKEYVARLEQISYWSDVRAIEAMVIEWKDEQKYASRRG